MSINGLKKRAKRNNTATQTAVSPVLPPCSTPTSPCSSARVVEMRYFAGMTEEDIAQELAVSVPTVKRDWRKARAFLFEQLQ